MRTAALFVLAATACTPRVPPSAAPASSPARDLACSLSDEVGARLAGSEGDAKAVAWATQKMTALGLANVHTEAVTVPHWVRGDITVELVAPRLKRLHAAALGGSVGTPSGGIEAEVVRVESLEALKALPREKVEGRIVFYDKVMERSPSGGGYGKTVDVRGRGAIEAARLGALASVIRSVGTSQSRFPHTGAMRYADDVAKIPAAALAIPDAELLRRTLEQGPVRLRLALGCRSEADAASANVIGEVKGTAQPEDVVLLGAHLDAWDLGDGAIDDAAGVGVVLDVAQRLTQRPPKRSVRVVLFANEENGLRGAKAYVEAHRDELPRHFAAMEVDSGAGRVTGVRFHGGPEAKTTMATLAPWLEQLGLPAAEESEGAGGADTGELEGVPQLELDQDRARYFDLHHSADDTCDKIDPADMAQVSAIALELTRTVADLQAPLGRVPKK